ncbi:metallophosphoesterase family protein [Primorskyibacter sp. S87]|uniref:metallophosphoesterase family protein n=1 Tax=Primorskyibacter sp. S87 TaxID=3415126 RepID=UPI003C7C46AC
MPRRFGRNRLQVAAALLVLLLPARMVAALDVIVISDLNGSYGSVRYDARVSNAVARIIEMKPDLVISTGDMVAGQRKPHLSESEVRAMWRAFHKAVSDPLERAGIPFAVTPGNHDASAYGGFERERQIFAQEWGARKPGLNLVNGDGYPFFYTFEMEGITFVSLDATTLGPLTGSQMRELSALSDTGNPVVTFSHLPLWPFAQQREREIIGDPGLEDLYHRNGVVLHLSGHHHAYFPGWKDGVAYVSQACLGGGSRRLIGETDRSAHSFTHIDIDASGHFDVEAYKAPDFRTRVDPRSLPAEVRTPKAVLKRLDLFR